MRKRHRILLVILAFIAGLLLLPWHAWVQQKLITAIQAKGITPVALTLDSIGFRALTLTDVALGDPALKLAKVDIVYSPHDLLNGVIEDVELTGLTLAATRTDANWDIPGLSPLLQSGKPEKAAAIPVTHAELNALPLRSLKVMESALHLDGGSWKLDAPIDLMLQKNAAAKATLESGRLQLTVGADAVTTGKLSAALTLDEAKKEWRGDWSLQAIMLASDAFPLPKLDAVGTVVVTSDTMTVEGTLNSADQSHHAAFDLHYSLSKPEASLLTITTARMPWGGGFVAANNVRVPLQAKKAIQLNLEANNLAIDTLLQALTGDKATGTGAVSGSIPITLTAEGQVRVGKGALKAEAPGVITLSPEAIPGDNPQVALVRDVLKNLHYQVLALELEMAPDNTLSATLAVEGRNPEVERGRPIKLKVHLSGDLLNLITQNVKLMTDPQKFIRQENHE